jgi:membrane fusion protein, heavy metal efflux system
MDAFNLPNPERLLAPNRNIFALGGACLLSALGLIAAALFHQAAPRATERASGMKTEQRAVTLTNGAAQWKALKLARATAPGNRWSTPYPARLHVNDAAASRVGAPVAGRVARVFVELGDTVKAGDKLFSVASSNVAMFRAEQRRAAVDLEVAKVAHERVVAMVDARALPGKQETESAAQVRESQLALELSNAKLTSLRVPASGGSDFVVVAPQSGVIVQKNVLPSQQVESDEVLLEVADLSTVWAVAEIFEADASRIQASAGVLLTSPLVPGLSLQSQVEMVASVVDPARHTVGVRAVIPNPEQKLRPGTYVELSFREPPQPNAVEIPASTLVSSGAERYVYVQQGQGRFEKRSVVAGWSREGRVLVTRGLVAGDVVVTEGASLLDNQIALDN